MPEVISLRQARPADAEAITQCVQAAYQRFVPRIGQPPGPLREDYARLVRERTIVVAAREEAVVGVLVLNETTEAFLLDNVAVHPLWQGQGIGRMLLDHAEHCATASGYDSIVLYTNELMVENRYLYARIGYREYDRRTEHGLSRIYMRKQLVDAPRSAGGANQLVAGPSPVQSCPLCGSANACQPAATGSFDSECWCRHVPVDKRALERVPDSAKGRACLCQRCAAANA